MSRWTRQNCLDVQCVGLRDVKLCAKIQDCPGCGKEVNIVRRRADFSTRRKLYPKGKKAEG